MTPTAQPGRGGGRPRRSRPTRPARPATVWPSPDPGSRHRARDGATGSAWLASAVGRLVSTYTLPGQTVLLLAPPAAATAATGTPSGVAFGTGAGPLAELHAQAWTVARLGRGVRARTARPDDGEIHTAGRPGARSGSGPGPGRRSALAAGPASGPAGDRADGDGPDRFDAVITAVDPADPGWVRTVAWSELLTPGGTLAVITYSDGRRGWLVDATPEVVRAAQRSGLALLDQVVLLETPVRTGRIAVSSAPHGNPPTSSQADGASHRVHSNLLLFSCPSSVCGRTRMADEPATARPETAA